MSMLRRLPFLCIAGFWVAMNVLLWRSEFGGETELSAQVPVQVVWEKILTSPDDSALQILHQGKPIGFCRWRATIGEQLPAGKLDEPEMEGRVKHLTGYTLDLEGSLQWEGSRFRFHVQSSFASNHVWQTLYVRTILKPTIWEIRASAANQTVRVLAEEEGGRWERTFAFDDLRNPSKLLAEFGVPFPALLLPNLPLMGTPASGGIGLEWHARNEWLSIAHARIKVYRIQTRLLDKHQAAFQISRVGEILRAELPGDWVLVNEALANL